jgi:hypothetical protein
MTIKDIYVGHTTNFIKRKQCHKNCCNSSQNKKHHLYKYEFIRNNGGWDNWSMIEVIKVKCIDVYDACRIEREYIEKLGATLNKYMPIIFEIEKNEHAKKYYKNYNQINKDKIKLYYEVNKHKLKEYAKKYYKEYNKKCNKEISEG